MYANANNVVDIAVAIVDGIRAGNSGGTVWTPAPNEARRAFHRRDETPEFGYVVGGVTTPRALRRDDVMMYSDMARTISEMLAESALSGRLFDGVGFWEDPSGLIHVDVVEWTISLDYAMSAAAERGEHSVWNIGRAAEIVTADYMATV